MADLITDPDTGVMIREMAGRSGRDVTQGDSDERKFLCRGSTDPLICKQALDNQRDAIGLFSYNNHPLSGLAWAPKAGAGSWEFTATYTQLPEPGDFQVSMDSSGGTGKQTEAWQQTAYGSNPPPYGTSINVDGEGKVQGVDRVIPSLKVQVVARIRASLITSPIDYAKTVASITGTVNNAPYLGFASGELLFLGASGPIIGDNPVLTYTFAASPNLTNQTIGPISGINKNGHDYIWFRYMKQQLSGYTVDVARAAYVAQVYTYANFGVLQIGA